MSMMEKYLTQQITKIFLILMPQERYSYHFKTKTR